MILEKDSDPFQGSQLFVQKVPRNALVRSLSEGGFFQIAQAVQLCLGSLKFVYYTFCFSLLTSLTVGLL